MSKYIPESALPHDGVERTCEDCGNDIIPPRISAGYPGSGRIVIGGYYGIPGREGIFCPACAQLYLENKRNKTK